MKNIFSKIINKCGLYTLLALPAMGVGGGLLASCSDMLETDNDSMVSNPALDQKTDSVFSALGIAQAMQQLADQYYYIGEMRGELVSVDPTKTDKNLQQLADYSATASNAYDSAYVYYKVINNCNYYLAHRDSALYTGSTNVSIDEYAAVSAWRAWAYLQLARTYCGNESGLTVPFFTEPLTSVSDIENKSKDASCQKNLSQIVEALAPELETLVSRYPNLTVPTYGVSTFNIGSTNWGAQKNINPALIFVPAEVILGEMYLETAQYDKAAKFYSQFLCKNGLVADNYNDFRNYSEDQTLPSDISTSFNLLNGDFTSIFANQASPSDVLTYIPMAVSSQRGTTTSIPLSYGYNYYSIDRSSQCPRVEKIQIKPSAAFHALTDSCDYYYYPRSYNGSTENISYPTEVKSFKGGDGRASVGESRNNSNSYMLNRSAVDTSLVYVRKAMNANVYLYRTSTIYLHLAEALNNMGYTDAAFAILKNGISVYLEDLTPSPSLDVNGDTIKNEDGSIYIPAYKYMSQRSVDMLGTTLPFLNAQYRSTFAGDVVYGIHNHGGGFQNAKNNEMAQSAKGSRGTAVGSQLNLMYLPEPIIAAKLEEIASKYGVTVGATDTDKQAAMQDLLCDEYAKEFAFEGARFYDLQRLARHFNETGVFGGNFGSKWFAHKLKGNNPTKDLTQPSNWYLPFK